MKYEVWNEDNKVGEVIATSADQAKLLAIYKFPVYELTLTIGPGVIDADEPFKIIAQAAQVSPEETFSRWYADKAQKIEANHQLGERIFDALAVLDISSVLIAFDGQGDDGQIIQISLRQRDKTSPPEAADIPFEGHTLYEAIEQFIYNRLSADHESREVDAGAFGKFFMYVASRETREQFTERLEDEDEDENEKSPRVFL
jgi:hypothetical protein